MNINVIFKDNFIQQIYYIFKIQIIYKKDILLVIAPFKSTNLEYYIIQSYINKQADQALRNLIEQGEEQRNWVQVAKLMKQQYGLEVTDRQCRQRWKYYLKEGLKRDQNQWHIEEVQYVITLLERYGPDVSLISQALQGRTSVCVRNLITNQLRKAIRFVQDSMTEQLKLHVQKIESKELIKIGGILVNQTPSTVAKTCNQLVELETLRLKLIQMWRILQRGDKAADSDLVDAYKQQFVDGRPKGPIIRRPEGPIRKIKRLQKQKQRQQAKIRAQQRSKNKEQSKAIRKQQRQKAKLLKQLDFKRLREQSLVQLQNNLKINTNPDKQKNGSDILFEDD